jgi:hypothetical protein
LSTCPLVFSTSAGVSAVQSTSSISSSKIKCFRHSSTMFASRAQPGYQNVSKNDNNDSCSKKGFSMVKSSKRPPWQPFRCASESSCVSEAWSCWHRPLAGVAVKSLLLLVLVGQSLISWSGKYFCDALDVVFVHLSGLVQFKSVTRHVGGVAGVAMVPLGGFVVCSQCRLSSSGPYYHFCFRIRSNSSNLAVTCSTVMPSSSPLMPSTGAE